MSALRNIINLIPHEIRRVNRPLQKNKNVVLIISPFKMSVKNTSPELYAWHYHFLPIILQAADNFDQKSTLCPHPQNVEMPKL